MMRLLTTVGRALAATAVALSISAAASAAPKSSVPVARPVGGADAALTVLLNRHRAAAFVAPVKRVPTMSRAAMAYARFQATYNLFGHQADGRNAMQRMMLTGFAPCIWGENVYSTYSTKPRTKNQLVAEAFNWWRHSPAHNRNMLDRRYAGIGTGFATAKHGKFYVYKVVMTFGTPAGYCR